MSRSKEWGLITEDQKEIILANQKSFPIKLSTLAAQLGVVVKGATLEAGVSGQIRLVDGMPEIKVNRHDNPARQRFTVAHELAHYLLHLDRLNGDGIVDDVLYRSKLSDELEAQANRLAADIVMPWSLIESSLAAIGKKTIREEDIEMLAKQADVSTTAMKIRLGKI